MNLLTVFSLLWIFVVVYCQCDLFQGACRCTPSHCDTVQPVGDIDSNNYVVYQTSKGTTDRLSRYVGNFSSSSGNQWWSIKINVQQKFQKIFGFGGALTDAATLNIMKMTPQVQQLILEQYYSENGIQYSSGRIPIASCDFSTHSYSYDNVSDDFLLYNFSVSPDLEFKIPVIKRVITMSSRPLRFFATPWSAPGWMKTTGTMIGGKLKDDPKYHTSWALYLSKFLDAYTGLGIPIWGITVQNEPAQTPSWDSMSYTAQEETDFIKNYLGPLLRKNHPSVNIIMHDDQRNIVVDWTNTILSDPVAASFVDGIGVHWYAAVDDLFPYWEQLTKVYNKFPTKFILPSEACEGYIPDFNGPSLGDWSRGQTYGEDILYDLQNYAVGWTDWNIVLDLEGGPNHLNNFVDSPILVNTTAGDIFYKNPMYYYMGHFSKFIPPGSVRINVDSEGPVASLETIAFSTPEGKVVVVVLNRDYGLGRDYYIQSTQGFINTYIPPASIQTYVFNE